MRRLVSLLCVAVLMAGLPVALMETADASTSGPTFQQYRGGITVDPGTGRVFVPADDSVFVYDSAGTFLSTIPNVYGAGAADLSGGFLWVLETTAGAIAKIDMTALTVVQTYSVGKPVSGGLLVVGSGAFLQASLNGYSFAPVHVELSTKAIVSVAGDASVQIARFPNDPSSVLFVGEQGSITRVAATAPYAYLDSFGTSAGGPVGFSPDGTKLYRGGFEFVASTLDPTGVIYEGSVHAPSPAFGGLLAGSDGTALTVATMGGGLSHRIPAASAASSPVVRLDGVALQADGTRAYAIEGEQDYSYRWLRLVTEPLAPTVGAVDPQSVTAGVPGTMQVTGRGLGATTAAFIGGVPATYSVVSTTQVEVVLPAGVGAGAKALSLAGSLGSVGTTVNVLANPGSVVNGFVRRGAAGLVGFQVTLSGGGLTSSRQVSTGAGGAFTFAAVPFGESYKLAFHDPTNVVPDFTGGPLIARPPDATTFDVDVLHPPKPFGSTDRRIDVPVRPVRELQIDPATSRVFVSAGDEIDVFAPDGTPLKRINQMWGVAGLAFMGGSLYATLPMRGKVVRIDPSTLTVTASWSLGNSTVGPLAAASGKLWLLAVRPESNYPLVASFDVVSGTQFVTDRQASSSTFLHSIVGAPNRLLVGIDYSASLLLNTATVPPSTVASTSYSNRVQQGDGSSGLAWDLTGRQYTLETLELDGVVYPTTGGYAPQVASSPGHGGVVAFGLNVARVGQPVNTHVLGVDSPRLSALDPAANTLATALTNDNDTTLHLYDLRPQVTNVEPATLRPGPQTLSFVGSGLGNAIGATLDGNAIVPTATTPTSVIATLPALAVGYHSFTATTEWGTSAPLLFYVGAPAPAPSVTAIAPPSVPTAGGPVTITGTNLSGTTSVVFGGTDAASFSVVSDTRIDAVAPVHAAGSAPVTVTTSSGTNTPPAMFAFDAPAPVVTVVDPSVGLPGTKVTITGTSLTLASAVTFGGSAGTITSNSDTSIVAVAPARAAGPVTVSVTTAGGSSAATPATTFTYLTSPPPVVSALAPASGSTRGGNLVTIYGAAFTGSNSVFFGDRSAVFQVVDNKTILAVAPPHAGGIVKVSVSTPFGTTPSGAGSQYTYVAPPPQGAGFHPLPPTRVLDTRTNLGIAGKVGTAPKSLAIRGVASVPTTASAVVLNVTVTNPSAPSFLTVFPSGGAVPNASNLNFGPGQTIANLVTVPVASDGAVALVNAAGTSDVVADVAGYYDYADTPSARDFYNPVSPTRVLDTRTTTPPVKVGATPKSVPIAGVAGLPPTGIDAVVVNVTVTNPSSPSFLTAYPSGTAKPTASNLNFASGQTIANLAVVKLGTGGALDLANAIGTTDVVLDVVGWFGKSYDGSGFFGVSPTRILDSRIGLGLLGKIGAAPVQVTGVGGVPVTGVTAVVVNLTATNATLPSYIVTWPWGSPPTAASTVNFAAGQTIPNLAVLKVGQDGKVGIANANGLTDVVGDVVGYYTS